mmetsp:Transcript_33214/g.98924  ORF Transcript_33214/g.98924 Transcript_33214/m.98924 type:complete len:265 (-) Transcript_33214:790-1584(-)
MSLKFLPTTTVTPSSRGSAGISADLKLGSAVPSSRDLANLVSSETVGSPSKKNFWFFSKAKPRTTGPVLPDRPKYFVIGSASLPSLLDVTNTSLPLNSLATSFSAANALPLLNSASLAQKMICCGMPDLKILFELPELNSIVRGSFSPSTNDLMVAALNFSSMTITERCSSFLMTASESTSFMPAALATSTSVVIAKATSSYLVASSLKVSNAPPESSLKYATNKTSFSFSSAASFSVESRVTANGPVFSLIHLAMPAASRGPW